MELLVAKSRHGLPDAICTLSVPSLYNPGGVSAAASIAWPTAMWNSVEVETLGWLKLSAKAAVKVPQLMVPPPALRMIEKEIRPFCAHPPGEPSRLDSVLSQMSTGVVPA